MGMTRKPGGTSPSMGRREIKVLVVGRTQANAEALSAMLSANPDVRLVAAITDSSRAVTEARNRSADVVLVEAGALPLTGLEVTRDLRDELGRIGIVVLADQTGVGFYQEAIRLRANDFLVMPVQPKELADSVSRAFEAAAVQTAPLTPAGAAPRFKRGQMVAVVSARGGTGKTLVAASLAANLAARHGEKIVAVDLDLQYGDLDLFLGIREPEGKTVHKLAGVLTELSSEILKAVLHAGPHRMGVLLAPPQPLDATAFGPDEIESLLVFLKENYPLLVLDTAAHLDNGLLLCLREADLVLLVVTPDLAGVRDAAKLIQVYRDHRYDVKKLAVVVNRVGAHSEYNESLISKTLGCKVLATLPYSPGAVTALLNASKSVDQGGRDPIFAELRALAQTVEQTVGARALAV